MILLDTHVVVWLVGNYRRLGEQTRRRIAADGDRRVSAMVSWEMAMMVDRGRMTIQGPLAAWLEASFSGIGATEVVVTGRIAGDAGSLSGNVHGDPCDRIMIATARALHCPLVTADRKILDYAALGQLRAIDARV